MAIRPEWAPRGAGSPAPVAALRGRDSAMAAEDYLLLAAQRRKQRAAGLLVRVVDDVDHLQLPLVEREDHPTLPCVDPVAQGVAAAVVERDPGLGRQAVEPVVGASQD